MDEPPAQTTSPANGAAPHDHDLPPAIPGAQEMLLAFLHERDVPCPRCDYNLRNAPQPACPECGEPLLLSVGLERPTLGPLLATTAPGLGCGVCGSIFALLTFMHPGAPPAIYLSMLLMIASGAIAVAILAGRRAFLRRTRDEQWVFAVISILLHVLLIAFVLRSFN